LESLFYQRKLTSTTIQVQNIEKAVDFQQKAHSTAYITLDDQRCWKKRQKQTKSGVYFLVNFLTNFFC
jgi:hypothetical protein